MKRLAVLFLTAAIALVAVPALRADAAPDGAALFKQKCATCHGPDGKGQNAMGKSMHLKDLASDEVQPLSNADLNKIIRDGKNKMPAYKTKLDQAQIDAVIEFIRTLKK